MYFDAATLRFNLNVGVNSSVTTLKSVGKIVNFWIFAGGIGQHLGSLFVSVIALVIAAMIASESMACVKVVQAGSTFWATGSNSSVPGNSPVAPTVFKETTATLNFCFKDLQENKKKKDKTKKLVTIYKNNLYKNITKNKL